jgi:hypothetical protein
VHPRLKILLGFSIRLKRQAAKIQFTGARDRLICNSISAGGRQTIVKSGFTEQINLRTSAGRKKSVAFVTSELVS